MYYCLNKELGIVKVADQKAMQRRLAYTAAIHLNVLVVMAIYKAVQDQT
jgi:hypothetical protein